MRISVKPWLWGSVTWVALLVLGWLGMGGWVPWLQLLIISSTWVTGVVLGGVGLIWVATRWWTRRTLAQAFLLLVAIFVFLVGSFALALQQKGGPPIRQGDQVYYRAGDGHFAPITYYRQTSWLTWEQIGADQFPELAPQVGLEPQVSRPVPEAPEPSPTSPPVPPEVWMDRALAAPEVLAEPVADSLYRVVAVDRAGPATHYLFAGLDGGRWRGLSELPVTSAFVGGQVVGERIVLNFRRVDATEEQLVSTDGGKTWVRSK